MELPGIEGLRGSLRLQKKTELLRAPTTAPCRERAWNRWAHNFPSLDTAEQNKKRERHVPDKLQPGSSISTKNNVYPAAAVSYYAFTNPLLFELHTVGHRHEPRVGPRSKSVGFSKCSWYIPRRQRACRHPASSHREGRTAPLSSSLGTRGLRTW